MHTPSYFVGIAAGAALAAVAMVIIQQSSHESWFLWSVAAMMLIVAGMIGRRRPTRPHTPIDGAHREPLVRIGQGDFERTHV